MSANIILQSDKVWLAERDPNDPDLHAKFLVSDFNTNKNGDQVGRETIENWLSTLVNHPLVGRIKGSGDEADFTGHNPRRELLKTSSGEYVSVVTYDTDAVGTFTSAQIETIDGQEVITGDALIWGRFPKVCQVVEKRINAGTLHTSWEIKPVASHQDNDANVVDNGYFVGVCLLGESVEPAVDAAHLMEVASVSDDMELAEAFAEDMKTNKENGMKKNEMKTAETIPQVDSSEADTQVTEDQNIQETTAGESLEPEAVETAADDETKTASLTTEDLWHKIGAAIQEKRNDGWYYPSYIFPEEHVVWARNWNAESDLDYVLFVYTVDGDEVTVDGGVDVKLTVSLAQVNDVIAEKDAALAQAATRAAELEAQIEAMAPFKEAYEQAERERIEAEKKQKSEELKQYALSSKLISEDELTNDVKIAELMASLDKAGIDQIIAARYMEKMKAPAAENEVPAQTEQITASLNDEEVKPVKRDILRAYISK